MFVLIYSKLFFDDNEQIFSRFEGKRRLLEIVVNSLVFPELLRNNSLPIRTLFPVQTPTGRFNYSKFFLFVLENLKSIKIIEYEIHRLRN